MLFSANNLKARPPASLTRHSEGAHPLSDGGLFFTREETLLQNQATKEWVCSLPENGTFSPLKCLAMKSEKHKSRVSGFK